MKRLPHVAILLVAVALVAANKGEKKKEKSDFEKIQGTWTIVENFIKGGRANINSKVGAVMVFSGKTLNTTTKGGQLLEGTFALRPDRKPQQLDIIFKRDGTVLTMPGIYELSGDTLKICLTEPGKPRPKAMGTAEDDLRQMIVLKRVKGGDKK